MLPLKQSLVKYENPQLISRRTDERIAKTGAQRTTSVGDIGARPKQIAAGHEKREFEDVLDVLLPPRKFHEDGKLYMQRVSRASATRNDILNLQEQLDQQLQQRDARELGLCPVRRELYDQLFDELMRQETIACPERGILLKRIRDDLRMTLAAYETLYESSIAFGVRKTLRAEKIKLDMKKKRDELLKEKSKVDEQYNQLLSDIEETRMRLQEEKEELAKQYGEEEELLAQANLQLKTQLEAIIAPM